MLGSHFSDSQTLVGSPLTRGPDLSSGASYAGLLIRATTFEGKPIFIRKKIQTDRGKKVIGRAGLNVGDCTSHKASH